MNENTKIMNDDEREIDIPDLFFSMLRHWRSLVIVLIIGILLGAGIGVLRGRNTRAVEPPAVSVNELSAEELAEHYGITEAEIVTMQKAYSYRQEYEQLLDYAQNSVLMNLPENGCAAATLLYSVHSDTSAASLAEQLKAVIDDGEVPNAIAASLEDEIEIRYLREIISASDSDLEEDSAILYIGQQTDIPVKFTILYPDADGAQTIADALKQQIAKNNLRGVTLLSDCLSETISISADTLDIQSEMANQMSTDYSTVISLESAMTDNEKAYYQAVYLKTAEEPETAVQETAAGTNSLSIGSLVKWAVIGFVGMGVCWCLIQILGYILSKKLHRPEEVQELFGLNLIGCMNLPTEPKKGLDAKIEKWASGSRRSADAPEYVIKSINTLPEQKIAVCVDKYDTSAEAFLSELAKKCGKLEVTGTVHGSESGLTAASASEGVILAIHVGLTNYTEIEQELEACRLQKIHVLGVIAVQ